VNESIPRISHASSSSVNAYALEEALTYKNIGCPIGFYRMTDMGCAIVNMSVEVARTNEIPVGTMKRVIAFKEHILLSNVGGKIYATQNDCGHQRASLARGTLEGNIVTCPLHGAKFDVTTGRNVAGIQMRMSPELMQKMPPEIIAMFQKTGEIISEIDIQPLKTYKVEVKGGSIYLDTEA
jgi:nitrite reductase/ring-hydroxylating ferredoxin subunit